MKKILVFLACIAMIYSGYNNGYNVINHYSGVSTSDGSIKYPKSYENTLWAKRVKQQ